MMTINDPSLAPPAPEGAKYVQAIFQYNHGSKRLVVNPPVAGAQGVVFLMDVSQSMCNRTTALQRSFAAAKALCPTPSTSLKLDKPTGATAIVGLCGVLTRAVDEFPGARYVLATDGQETCFKGPLKVGFDEDGADRCVELDSANCMSFEYQQAVADHLNLLGEQFTICIMGIGTQAEGFMRLLSQRSNLVVAHVPDDATADQMAGVVRALGHSPLSRLRAGEAGEPRMILPASPLVQEVLAGLTELDRAALMSAGVSTTVDGVPQLTVETTADVAKMRVLAVVREQSKTVIGEEDQKYFRAIVAFFGESVADEDATFMGIPANMLTRRNGRLFKLPETCDMAWLLNHAVAKLASGANALFKVSGKTPDGGATMSVGGGKAMNFPKGCVIYKSAVPLALWEELAADAAWATPRNELMSGDFKPAEPKKRKRSTGEDGEAGSSDSAPPTA